MIKLEKAWHGLSASMLINERVCFFAGKSDSWGISAKISFYENSLTLQIFNLYAGVEIWRKN